MNAIGQSKFRIYSNQNLIQEIILDLTNEAGLIETVIPIKLTHTLINYSTVEKFFGYKIKWTLNYSQWITIDNLLRLQEVLRYAKQGFNVNFTPRIDLPQRNYEVIITNESIDVGIINKKNRYIYNRLVVIEVMTKHLIQDLNWLNTEHIPIGIWNDEFAFVLI